MGPKKRGDPCPSWADPSRAEPSRMKLKWVKQKQCVILKADRKLLAYSYYNEYEKLIDLAIIHVERDNCVCTEPNTQIIPVPSGLLLSWKLEMFFNLRCVIRIKLIFESIFSLSSSERGGLFVCYNPLLILSYISVLWFSLIYFSFVL
jgi:hypothetical protein